MSPESREITDDFLAQLKEDLVCRRLGRGMSCLHDRQHLFTTLDPQQKNAARFGGYLAQWVDIGFERPALVKQIVARFTKSLAPSIFTQHLNTPSERRTQPQRALMIKPSVI